MKKLLPLILFIVFVASCTPKLIYIDSRLDTIGVDIWDKDVDIVRVTNLVTNAAISVYMASNQEQLVESYFETMPDVFIIYTNSIYNMKESYIGVEQAIEINVDAYSLRLSPSVIYVETNHPAVIAHEFGHSLGKRHNNDTNSIMYPRLRLSRSVSNYKEFK